MHPVTTSTAFIDAVNSVKANGASFCLLPQQCQVYYVAYIAIQRTPSSVIYMHNLFISLAPHYQESMALLAISKNSTTYRCLPLCVRLIEKVALRAIGYNREIACHLPPQLVSNKSFVFKAAGILYAKKAFEEADKLLNTFLGISRSEENLHQTQVKRGKKRIRSCDSIDKEVDINEEKILLDQSVMDNPEDQATLKMLTIHDLKRGFRLTEDGLSRFPTQHKKLLIKVLQSHSSIHSQNIYNRMVVYAKDYHDLIVNTLPVECMDIPSTAITILSIMPELFVFLSPRLLGNTYFIKKLIDDNQSLPYVNRFMFPLVEKWLLPASLILLCESALEGCRSTPIGDHLAKKIEYLSQQMSTTV